MKHLDQTSKFPLPGLEDAVVTIARTLSAKAIYLYGSYGRGEGTPTSDVDLMVVVDDANAASTRGLASRAYDALWGSDLPIELKVVSERDFAKRSRWNSSVEHAVVSEGRKLYDSRS